MKELPLKLGLPAPPAEVRSEKVIKEADDIVKIVAETIDNVADLVIGGRPASRLIRAAVHIAPAPTFERITGLPAPGKVVDALLDKIAYEVDRLEARIFPGERKAKALEEEVLE